MLQQLVLLHRLMVHFAKTSRGRWLRDVFFILAAIPSAAHMPDGAIVLMDADGAAIRMVADGPGVVTGPTWGSDGRIAFISTPDTAGHNHPGARLGIYQPTVGIRLVDISEELRGVRSLAFHDDRIVFVAQPPGSQAISQNDLFVVDVERGITVNLTNGAVPYIGMPSWSSAGEIAFTAGIGHEWRLHVWQIEGLAAMPHRTFDFDASVNFILNVAWSPDGSRFAVQQISDHNSEIFVMNADGTDARNITDHPAADSDPSWSPDGRELTFVSDRGGSPSVYRALADGSGIHQITDDEGVDLQPHWSERGICFVSDRDIQKGVDP